MGSTVGIVEVRIDSARAWSRLCRKLGRKSLLEHVVRRVTDCQRLDRTVAVAFRGPEAGQLRDLIPPDVPLYLGQAADWLELFVAAAVEYQAESVVRVRVESPFVEPVFIDRLATAAAEHPECDYISFCLKDGRPVVLSPLGLFAEWCRVSALQRAHREAQLPADRDQPTRYLYGHPELFQIRLLAVPAELDRDDLRLAVQHEEEWDHIQTIYDALGPDALDWRQIARLLGQQPGLRERMALLNRTAPPA
jgi:spore coat polysaccharide biosynthesis protein SpsF